MGRRSGLHHSAIVAAAVRVADESGLNAVTMRNVAAELGVEAMSLYHHVANKDALLDGLAESVVALIELPEPGAPWRLAMYERAWSARRALGQHPWALGLFESRQRPSVALMAHHNAVLRCLREDGFSVELATHAFSAIDSYVYGFVLTETTLPFAPEDGGAAADFADSIGDLLDGAEYPFLVENVQHLISAGDFTYGDEFDFGLELILDGLAAHREVG